MNPHADDPATPDSRPAETPREARVRSLKARIRSGRYDADRKIDSLIEEVVRDAL